MKHTPGPWEYHQTDDGHEIRMGEAILTPYSHNVELVISYDHGLYPDLDSVQYVTAEANARLIAAAPDLLEACEKALLALQEIKAFCGEGLEVYNWHQNGDPEPFEHFIEENMDENLLEQLKQVISKAKEEV